MLASDGLWDTHTNEEAVALVSKVINQEVIFDHGGYGKLTNAMYLVSVYVDGIAPGSWRAWGRYERSSEACSRVLLQGLA